MVTDISNLLEELECISNGEIANLFINSDQDTKHLIDGYLKEDSRQEQIKELVLEGYRNKGIFL